MIPVNFQTITYGSFFTMPNGNKSIKIYFHNDIVFPLTTQTGQVITSPEDFVAKITQPVFDKFNALNFGVTFSVASIERSDRGGILELGTINHTLEGTTISYANRNSLQLKLVLVGTYIYNIDMIKYTLEHEMLHNLGFGHKTDSVLKSNKPPFFGTNGRVDGHVSLDLNYDSVHGLRVVYDNATSYKLSGTLLDRTNYVLCDAFLVANNQRMMYQSPTDPNGYAEFRFNEVDVQMYFPNRQFYVMLIGKDAYGKFPFYRSQIFTFPPSGGGTVFFNISTLPLLANTLDEIPETSKK